MKYLLDTHTAIWEFIDSPELTDKVKALIDDYRNEIFVSIVSAWEIAIKRSLNRKDVPLCSTSEFFNEIAAAGFELLTLEPHHVIPIESLPYHHGDPFDRLLISTAIAENMTFVTADKNAPKYDVNCLW